MDTLEFGDNPENWEMSLDEFAGVAGTNLSIDPDLMDNSNELGLELDMILTFNLTTVEDVAGVAKNYRFLLFMLSLFSAIFWILYITFYHSRVVGLIITKVLNSFVVKEGYINIGSISISVLSGKIMFRDVLYITEDHSLRVQDGWMIFRWWKEYQPKEDILEDMAGNDTRLSILLNGYEYHRFNRSKVYSRLEKLFGLDSIVFPEHCRSGMMGDGSVPQNNNTATDKPTSAKGSSWRDLIPVVKVEICRGRSVFGNSLVPYTLALVVDEAHLIFTTMAADCSLDKFTHVVKGRTENFKVVLSQSPKYTGLKDEPPRLMGEGFGIVTSKNMEFSHYVDEPGIVPSQPEMIQLAGGDFVRANPPTTRMEILFGKGTHFSYGPWADRQRDLLFKLFYPQDYQEKMATPKPMPGENRQIQSFDIFSSITEDATAEILFTKDQKTNVIHLDIGAGSNFEVNVPWTTQSDGYTTNIIGQLFQLKTSTSLQYRNFVESDVIEITVQSHFPIHWNDHQEWRFDLTGYKTSVSFTYAHKWFFQDLINDWSSISPPDILNFVPYTWKFNLCLKQFEIIVQVNEYNWIDCTGMDQENNLLAAVGDKLGLSFELPSHEFLPETILLNFQIQIENGFVNFFLPQVSTAFVAVKSLGKTAKIRSSEGEIILPHGYWGHRLKHQSKDIGRASKAWRKCQQDNNWVECWSVPSCAIGVSFTYHPMPPLGPSPRADITAPEMEEALLSPIRPSEQDKKQSSDSDSFSFPDFDPLTLPADRVHVEVEVGPSELLLYGSFLKLILNLKENIFGDHQNFVEMSADEEELRSSNPTGENVQNPTTGGKLDFRKYRPLEVTVSASIHDIQGHLLKNCNENDPCCPTICMERIGFELKKGFRETQLQVLLSPIKVLVSDTVKRPDSEDKHLGEGHLIVSGLQVRGHSMFSNEGRNLEQETLEYAWLIELQLGMLSGRLTTPHLENIFSGVQSFLLPVLDEENSIRSTQPFLCCHHGNNQFECVEQNSLNLRQTESEKDPSGACLTLEETKYNMLRVSVDAVEVHVVEEGTVLRLSTSSIRIAECNLHGRVMREGVTVLINDLQLRHLMMVNPAFTKRFRFSDSSVFHNSRETITASSWIKAGQPQTGPNQISSTSWLEAGAVTLGPVCLEMAKKGRKQLFQTQKEFLVKHDKRTRRLWFLWKTGMDKKCGCSGGCAFFGNNMGGSRFFQPSKMDYVDGVNVACFRVKEQDPGFGQSILKQGKLLFDTSERDHTTKDVPETNSKTASVRTQNQTTGRMLPSLSTRRSLFSESKVGPVEHSALREKNRDTENKSSRHSYSDNQQNVDEMLRNYLREGGSEQRVWDGSYDSLDSLTDARLSYHEEETIVNLQLHMNKPITESSLLMPCYTSHLTQLKSDNWYVNAPTCNSSDSLGVAPSIEINDGKVHYAGSKYLSGFEPLLDGFTTLTMVNRNRNLNLGHDDMTQAFWQNAPSQAQYHEVTNGRVGVAHDEVDNAHFYQTLLNDGWRESEDDTNGTATSKECTTFVIRTKNDLNIMASPLLLEGLQKFVETITPTLRSLHPLTVVNYLHGACISSVENANLLKKEKSLLLMRIQDDATAGNNSAQPRLLEQVLQNTIKGSISIPKVNMTLLQASVVEEAIAFSALDNIRDLMCVSIIAVGIERTQINFLHREQERKTVQVFHRPIIPSKGAKKRKNKLSGIILSEPVLIENSEKQSELITASIDISKAHAQLRRLKNDCGILKEAVITAIPKQNSKVFFQLTKLPKHSNALDGKNYGLDANAEEIKMEMGFIMWECGLEGISLKGMKNSDSQKEQSRNDLREKERVSVTLCNELRTGAGNGGPVEQKESQGQTEDGLPTQTTPKLGKRDKHEDSSSASCAIGLKEMWFNFAAPPKTSIMRKIDYTKVDWNLVSTASTAINAWLNPSNQLFLAVKKMQKGYFSRTIGLMASLMAEALDVQPIHQLNKSKHNKLTPLAKTLQDDPSCQLCNVLRRYIAETDIEKIEGNVAESELPQLSTLRQGVIVLSRQWKNVLYTPLLLEHNLQSNFRKSKNVTVIYTFPQGESDGEDGEVAIDEPITFVDAGAVISPGMISTEGMTLKEYNDQDDTKDYSGALKGRRRSISEHSDEESLLLGAHTKFPQHPSLTLLDAHVIFNPLLTTMGLMPHQIMGYSFDNLGTHLSTKAAIDRLRVDIVKSALQGFGPQSNSGVDFVLSIPPEISPTFLCEKISLDLDFQKSPDMSKEMDMLYQSRNYWKKQAKSAIIFSINIDCISQQVNMPLLRLIHQITNMYQNVNEAKVELRKQRSQMASFKEHLEPERATMNVLGISTSGGAQINNSSSGSIDDQETTTPTPTTPISGTNPSNLPKRTQSIAQRFSALRHRLILERSIRHLKLKRPGVVMNPPPPNCWRTIENLISLYATRPETKMVTNNRHLSSLSFNKTVPRPMGRDVLDNAEKGKAGQEQMSPSSTLEKQKGRQSESVHISLFGIVRIHKTKLLATLSGLKLEAEIENLQTSCSFKKKEKHSHMESSITGNVGQSRIGLLEGAAPNQKTVVTVSISKSGGLYTTVSRKMRTQNHALLSVGPINIEIPQHPVVLHGMMTRGTQRLSSTLQEFRVRRFSRGSAIDEVDFLAHQSYQVDSSHYKLQDQLQEKSNRSPVPVPQPLQIQFTVVVESLGVTAALLPSLQAQYKMEMVKSCGMIGSKTNFQVVIPVHTLSFETNVSDGSTLPGAASISLPKVNVTADYIQEDSNPFQEAARTNIDGSVPPHTRDYISANADIGALDHTLTTDLLNHLVFVQKVFMKEVNEVILKVSGGKEQPVLLRDAPRNNIGSPLPLFTLAVRLQGIQITATTPTDIAVRLETSILKFKMSNRVKNDLQAGLLDHANKVFIKSEVDVSLSLGQLIRNAVFEEADLDFQQYAFFKTKIGLRNVTDMNSGNSSPTKLKDSEGQDKKVVLIKLTRPLINVQPVAVDKAILMWLNYKNAYEYWNEQRSGLNSEARQRIGATRGSNDYDQSDQSQTHQRPKTASDLHSKSSTLFLQLNVNDLGISVPLKPSLQGLKMDAENRGAIVVTLGNTSISACSSGSVVSKGRFTELCIRFTEDMASMDDWKPNLDDPTVMNICVVSEGTYEVCSRTTSGKISEGRNAKLFLNVKWQMEGVDIHMDPNIGKQLRTLGHTLTTLTVFKEDEDEEVEERDGFVAPEDVPDSPGVNWTAHHQPAPSHFTFEPAVVLRKQRTLQVEDNFPAFLSFPTLSPTQRRSLLGKEMQERISLINELSKSGSPPAEIEEERKRLQELENMAFRDFRRDLIKKLRRQSTVKPDREVVGLGQRSKSLAVPIPDSNKQSEWRQHSLDSKGVATLKNKDDFARVWLKKVREKKKATTGQVDEVDGSLNPKSSFNQEITSQEPHVDFELDVKVFINRGKCVLHTKSTKSDDETASRRRRPSGHGSIFSLNSPTVLPGKGKHYSSATRLKTPFGVIGGSLTDVTIFYIPGLDVKIHYDSTTISHSRSSGTKRASIFASVTLHSVPETIISPHILNFLEQNLEMMPVAQPGDRNNNSKPEEGNRDSGSDIDEEDVATNTFPVDVTVYFHMQPSTFRFTCQPVSRVECMLRLPAVDIVYSSKRGEGEGMSKGSQHLKHLQHRNSTPDSPASFRPKLRRAGVVGLSGQRDSVSSPGGLGTPSSLIKGFSVTGCLSDFSLYIFHPYGAAAKKDKWSPLSDNERRDSVSINVEFVKFHLARSRKVHLMSSGALSSSHPAAIHFSTIADVGSASFKYDMRRLIEILAFPKAWYKQSLVRRVLLGDLSTAPADSDDSTVRTPIRKTSTRRSPSFRLRKELGTINEATNQPGSVPTWETLVLLAINFTKLNIQMNMGNVMGNVGWLIRNVSSEGKLSIGSTGHKNLHLDVGLNSSYIEAKGGIVAGTFELASLNTQLNIQQDPRVEPRHTLGLNLHGLELRLDFMGTSALMGRVSGLSMKLKDEWLVQQKERPHGDTLATYRPAMIFIHGDMGWDQLQLMISKSTTVDLHKMQCKLEEFFSQQFKSGKWVLSSMYREASSPLTPNTKRRLQHTEEGRKNCFQPQEHRHWHQVLENVSLMSISSKLAPFPEAGTVLGGNVKLHGDNISLACFHGINFKAKSWALFSLKEPFISFSTEAQEINPPGGESSSVHVVQNLNLSLGQQDRHGTSFYSFNPDGMAMISKITRNVMFPPQFRTLHEWFHYAFAPSDIDDVSRFPSLERERADSLGAEQRHIPAYLPDPNHNKEVIFSLPRLELFFKTEQSQPHSGMLGEGKPVVDCSFITELENHIFVSVDAEAFFFLHDLITSYIKEKDKLINAQLAGMSHNHNAECSSPTSPTIPGSPTKLQRDWRDYQCSTWQLEPTIRLLSWAGKSIEPYGMDYILNKLGFSHARVTIPKWIQRGCCDPLDELLSLLIMRMVDLARRESQSKD